MKAVQSLDAYPKVMEDYVTGSTSGGVITFMCAFICLLLFFSEYSHHRTTVVKSELTVRSRGERGRDTGRLPTIQSGHFSYRTFVVDF